MRNVLIIAIDFPPIGRVAVQRTVKFVKYLPSFGWNPIILTVRKDRHTKMLVPMDYSLYSDLAKNVIVYETEHLLYWLFYPLFCMVEQELKGCKFYRYMGVKYIAQWVNWLLVRLVPPTPFIGWYLFAVRKGKFIIKKHDIDMIYSTSPSPVAHVVACKLAKKYNLPWVADFRDPWTYAHFNKLIWPVKLLDTRLEKKVLARADRLVITLPKIIDEFKTLRKKFNPAQCFTILNGYDEEDFKDISPHTFKRFTIVYPGKLEQSVLSPHHFFAALNSLFQEHPDLRSEIKVIFIGRRHPFVIELVKEYELEGCVEMEGYIEHKKVLPYICGASVLFLLTDETEDSKKPFQGKDAIPAKLYEYLRARRPILALVPQDCDCAQIVRITQSGVVVDPRNHQKAKAIILDMYEKYKKGKLELEPNHSLIRQYERKVLTEKLAAIFDDLLLERKGNEK